MTIMRTAMISPQIAGEGGAVHRLAATQVYEGTSRPRKIAQAASSSVWRRAVIEGYPIAGLALLIAYFARTLLLSVQLAD